MSKQNNTNNMSKKKTLKRIQEYNLLLETIRSLTYEDLTLLYIEAKTGDQGDIDQLPVMMLQDIEAIGEQINKLYGDRILKNLEKE